MARISKDQHPRISQMVDNEHRKVAEVWFSIQPVDLASLDSDAA